MRLRNQILALSLMTLLLPLAGWKLVREMEAFLREAEEDALLVAARTVARALPAQYRGELEGARGRVLALRRLPVDPAIDGYLSDWPQAGEAAQSLDIGRYHVGQRESPQLMDSQSFTEHPPIWHGTWSKHGA